ncbi:hypothetical protein GDI2330 [Gluconacetobacter diazotrophicus PA1 5]|uniref:Uncharacterized protein n=1 Tax=Gluconacetobacter diazotrophicus (strain ATCC 49037 / DSM 5601 / CCUG 37298 / CIP 103539 / LMG 7603 / PAl5) TaxID=272568 RepID=A9HM81_GLUDA|nr:hypothetical protein GDI2330 [Gluconacetobacter diazotrophicus PA1 5]
MARGSPEKAGVRQGGTMFAGAGGARGGLAELTSAGHILARHPCRRQDGYDE